MGTINVITYTQVSDSSSVRTSRSLDEFAEIIRKHVEDAINVGYNDTRGAYTDVGITYNILNELGIIPGPA